MDKSEATKYYAETSRERGDLQNALSASCTQGIPAPAATPPAAPSTALSANPSASSSAAPSADASAAAESEGHEDSVSPLDLNSSLTEIWGRRDFQGNLPPGVPERPVESLWRKAATVVETATMEKAAEDKAAAEKAAAEKAAAEKAAVEKAAVEKAAAEKAAVEKAAAEKVAAEKAAEQWTSVVEPKANVQTQVKVKVEAEQSAGSDPKAHFKSLARVRSFPMQCVAL